MAITLQDYSLLREIQSLDIYVKTHMDKISSERQRTEQIRRMREKRSDQLNEIEAELKSLETLIKENEKELFVTESNLEQAKVNLGSAGNEAQMVALEKQIHEGQISVDRLENIVLELLSKSEQLEASIQEAKQFLEGSQETLNEIESEVQEIADREQGEIDRYNNRIAQLLANIPDALSKAFELARKKHRFNNPITKIKGNSCMMCRFILDSQTSGQVELFRTIEFCGQCERLIAPLEA